MSNPNEMPGPRHRERSALGRGASRAIAAADGTLLLLGQDHRRVLPALVRARVRPGPRTWTSTRRPPTPSARASGPASAASRTSRRWPSSTRRTVAELCRFIERAEQAPTLDELAERARAEHATTCIASSRRSPASRPRPTRRRTARSACAQELARSDTRDRGDLRRRLQLQRPLLRDVERDAGHDADAPSAPAAPTPTSASRSASARWARSWSRRASAASARSRSATIPTRWRATCRTGFRRRG